MIIGDGLLVLAINPGSTSTKCAVFENSRLVCEKNSRHSPEEFSHCPTILSQKEPRLRHILDMLRSNGLSPQRLSAVVGRGGLVAPLVSGTYLVSEDMLADLSTGDAAEHASALGGIIAAELGKEWGIPAFVVDPVVVDEMEPHTKLTGIPGITRRSVFHALNTKAVARRCAEQLGTSYESARFVVAHLGGGITVGAHKNGRVVDVNDAMSGDGPFTPERCGSVPLEPVIEMCFSGRVAKEDLLALCHRGGGVKAHLGTNDMKQVEEKIRQGDEYAALVMDAMAYQVAKAIGAMMAALEGRADAIILTGGLACSARFTEAVKQRVGAMGQVLLFPGEDEMAALAAGALRVLEGKEEALVYKGKVNIP